MGVGLPVFVVFATLVWWEDCDRERSLCLQNSPVECAMSFRVGVLLGGALAFVGVVALDDALVVLPILLLHVLNWYLFLTQCAVGFWSLFRILRRYSKLL